VPAVAPAVAVITRLPLVSASAPRSHVPHPTISQPIGIAKAPVLVADSIGAVRTTRAMHGMNNPVNSPGLMSHQALPLPLHDDGVSPTSVMPKIHNSASQTRILLAKAVPSAKTIATDNSAIFITREPGVTMNSHVLSTPVKSQPAIQLQGPYIVKAKDTWFKIARAYATTPDALAKLNPGLSPKHPLVVNTRIEVPHPDTHLYLNNHPLNDTPRPFIVRGCSLVPFRKIIEAEHGMVIWIPKTREVNAWVSKTFMGITIGSKIAHINSNCYMLPVAATLSEARAMVPLRYLAAALDLQIEYNAETGTYFLISRATP